jgi:hypothetical protein
MRATRTVGERQCMPFVRQSCAQTRTTRATRRPRRRRVPPRSSPEDLPEWYTNLKELAKEDEDLAELLLETQGDPAALESKLKREMDALHDRIVGDSFGSGGSGELTPPKVEFRAMDPFDTWIWIELYEPAVGGAAEMLQEVVNSWFMLGKLGAFDSSNLQVLYADGRDFEYEEPDERLLATMHEMTEMEFRGLWGRFCVDMGTSDELAFDILLNALRTFSREHVAIRTIQVGGEGIDSDDWPLPE